MIHIIFVKSKQVPKVFNELYQLLYDEDLIVGVSNFNALPTIPICNKDMVIVCPITSKKHTEIFKLIKVPFRVYLHQRNHNNCHCKGCNLVKELRAINLSFVDINIKSICYDVITSIFITGTNKRGGLHDCYSI